MKKTFSMEHPKIKYPRMIEGAKNEIRKYIKRERCKELPEGIDFWDFDCKFGETEPEAKPVHLKEIDGCINDAAQRGLMSFYVEVIRKEGIRKKKNVPHTAALPKLKGFGED